MLTIQNINKIEQKTLGKKNFYVVRVEDIVLYSPITFDRTAKYIFELSNRKYAITITLEREGSSFNNQLVYKLHSSSGNILYVTQPEITNMDIFIDKLRFVALG